VSIKTVKNTEEKRKDVLEYNAGNMQGTLSVSHNIWAAETFVQIATIFQLKMDSLSFKSIEKYLLQICVFFKFVL
jgi:hypothetical protein